MKKVRFLLVLVIAIIASICIGIYINKTNAAPISAITSQENTVSSTQEEVTTDTSIKATTKDVTETQSGDDIETVPTVGTISKSSSGEVSIEEVSDDNNLKDVYIVDTEAAVGGKLHIGVTINNPFTADVYVTYISAGRTFTSYVYDMDTESPYIILSDQVKLNRKYELIDISYANENGEKYYYSINKNGDFCLMVEGQYVVVASTTTGRSTSFKVTKAAPELTDMYVLGDTTVKADQKLSLKVKTTGTVDVTRAVIQNKEIPTERYLLTIDSDGIDLSKTNIVAGTYVVEAIYLNPGIDGSYAYYSLTGKGDAKELKFNVEFTVTSDEEEILENAFTLNEITIDKTSVSLNEKVDIGIGTDHPIMTAMLVFKGASDTVIVDVKNLTTEPYFVIPYTATSGSYQLSYVVLKDQAGNVQYYTKGDAVGHIQHFDFDNSLTITSEVADSKIFGIDNNRVDDTIIEKLGSVEAETIIEINAFRNPVVSRKVFEAVKGKDVTIVITSTDSQWTFTGKDIKDSKNIDVSIVSYPVSEDNIIKSKVNSGIILDFSNEGQLPGKCTIRVYNNDTLRNALNGSAVNIYYYNKELGKFLVIDTNSDLKNGYYLFDMDHNSKYVLTTETIADEYIYDREDILNKGEEENALEGFTLSKEVKLTIAIVVVVIVIILLITIITSMKKGGKQTQNTPNTPNKPNNPEDNNNYNNYNNNNNNYNSYDNNNNVEETNPVNENENVNIYSESMNKIENVEEPVQEPIQEPIQEPVEPTIEPEVNQYTEPEQPETVPEPETYVDNTYNQDTYSQDTYEEPTPEITPEYEPTVEPEPEPETYVDNTYNQDTYNQDTTYNQNTNSGDVFSDEIFNSSYGSTTTPEVEETVEDNPIEPVDDFYAEDRNNYNNDVQEDEVNNSYDVEDTVESEENEVEPEAEPEVEPEPEDNSLNNEDDFFNTSNTSVDDVMHTLNNNNDDDNDDNNNNTGNYDSNFDMF